MADQRSSFRFRMPRLRPSSVPPPRSTTRRPSLQPEPPIPPPASDVVAPAPPSTAIAPPPQDEPRSMPTPLPQPSPVVSSTAKSPEPTRTPSQTRVSSPPPSPSTTPQITSHPSSSPPTSPSPSPSPLPSQNKITSLPPSDPINVTTPKEASSPSSTPMPAHIASYDDQKDADLALNNTPHAITQQKEEEMKTTTETIGETFMEQPKVEEKQQDAINIPNNTPETKSMISQPLDTQSPQNPKPVNRAEASTERDTSPRKQFSNEKPLSVITLAGDNRGTSMSIGPGVKREKAIHIYRRYKDNHDEIADMTTDGEESSSNGKKSEKDSEPTEKNAYINCNIQGINNSMVFNSSFAERNPGVHLSRNPENENKSKRKKWKPMDTNSSQKNTTIRRRCLRGFFMESSDSDPEKPRRHGCRYTGGEKSKKEEEMEMEVP